MVTSLRWMRRRGDKVTITAGNYAGHTGTIESNVYQKTVDYPDEWANGFHVTVDTEELVTVRWDQVDVVNKRGPGVSSRASCYSFLAGGLILAGSARCAGRFNQFFFPCFFWLFTRFRYPRSDY